MFSNNLKDVVSTVQIQNREMVFVDLSTEDLNDRSETISELQGESSDVEMELKPRDNPGIFYKTELPQLPLATSPEDFSKTCRICFRIVPLKPLQIHLTKLIEQITSIKVPLDETLPKGICDDCNKNLGWILSFLLTIKSNEAYLKQSSKENNIQHTFSDPYKIIKIEDDGADLIINTNSPISTNSLKENKVEPILSPEHVKLLQSSNNTLLNTDPVQNEARNDEVNTQLTISTAEDKHRCIPEESVNITDETEDSAFIKIEILENDLPLTITEETPLYKNNSSNAMDIFLRKSNLEDLRETIKENHITLEIAKRLTEQEIKELIPSVGKRRMFTEALQSFQGEYLQVESAPVIKDYEIEENNFLEALTPPLSSSTISILTCRPSTSFNQTIVSDHGDVSYCELENTYNPTALPEFELNTLLETSPLGSLIIKHYEINKSLDNSKRTLLVDIIAKRIFNFLVKHRLTHSDYTVLTSKIISLFPTECAGTYYVPPIPKKNSVTNKPVVAKGRLIDKVRNLLRLSRSITREKRETVSQPSVREEVLGDLNEDKKWLETRNEPWSEVVQKWKNTMKLRKLSEATTVDSFFLQWPILKDRRSVLLINMDYDIMYPDVVVNLQKDWFQFMEKLLTLKRTSLRDKTALHLLEELETEDCKDDTKVALHLKLLPSLIPPKSRIKLSNHKHWKFSSAEVLDSMFMHVKVAEEIENSICQYRNKMYELKQCVQPYILAEGPTLQNIRSVYLVVDKIRFKCDNMLKALDLNFKIFHVANAGYPAQSEYLWLIIQKIIYRVSTPHDKVIPYILDIIENFKEI